MIAVALIVAVLGLAVGGYSIWFFSRASKMIEPALVEKTEPALPRAPVEPAEFVRDRVRNGLQWWRYTVSDVPLFTNGIYVRKENGLEPEHPTRMSVLAAFRAWEFRGRK